MPENHTHDYVRRGTASLFAAFNTVDVTVTSSITWCRAIELKRLLAEIDPET